MKSARHSLPMMLALALAAGCTNAPSAPNAGSGALTPRSLTPLADQLAGVSIIDLGTLPGFFHFTATAVNESGWVVGVAAAETGTAARAFMWKPGVGMSDLGSPPGFTISQAWAINSAGDVAGLSAPGPNDGTTHATLWHAGNAIDLGTLNPASTSSLASRAAGINDGGVVVGTSETGLTGPNPQRLAFRWAQATGMVALFAPPGTRIAEARAINNVGQVVGYVQSTTGVPHAALWSGSSFTDLGVLPGGTESMAAAINDAAVVAGTSTFSSPWNHAFIWTTSGGMTDLGALPGTIPLGPTSEAFGVNNAGDIVGRSRFQNGSNPAVLWRTGVIYSLPPLTAGVELGTARDINNSGRIVGTAELLSAGTRAVMWTLPSNGAPVANAGGPYQGRKKKEAIAFDGRGSTDPDGDALSFVWNFGDGTPTGTGATTSHVYERLGTYTATLTVSDGRGGSATASVTVEILPPGKLDR